MYNLWFWDTVKSISLMSSQKKRTTGAKNSYISEANRKKKPFGSVRSKGLPRSLWPNGIGNALSF